MDTSHFCPTIFRMRIQVTEEGAGFTYRQASHDIDSRIGQGREKAVSQMAWVRSFIHIRSPIKTEKALQS